MKKQLIIVCIFVVIATNANAKFGIGAGAGIIYPGFSESSIYGSQFGLGGGFDIFLRHTLLQFSDNLHIDARYSYRNYKADVNLPNTATTRFGFNYLGLGLFMEIISFGDFDIYAGGGVNVEFLFRVGRGRDWVHSRELRANNHWCSGWCVRRDLVLHHVQGHEPVVF